MKHLISVALFAAMFTLTARAQSSRTKVIIATAYCQFTPGGPLACAVWGWFSIRIRSGFGGLLVQVSPTPSTVSGKLPGDTKWRFTYEDGTRLSYADQKEVEENAVEDDETLVIE